MAASDWSKKDFSFPSTLLLQYWRKWSCCQKRNSEQLVSIIAMQFASFFTMHTTTSRSATSFASFIPSGVAFRSKSSWTIKFGKMGRLLAPFDVAGGESVVLFKGKGGGGGGGHGGRPGAGKGQGPGNAGGWPSTTGKPSGGGRSNNPPAK